MPSEEYIRDNYIPESGKRALLLRCDAEYLLDLEDEFQTFHGNVLETTKCKKIEEVSEETFNKQSIKKTQLAELLGDVLSLVSQQHDMVRDLRAANDLLKTELLESQSKVIEIQDELLKCNREKFQSLETTVKSTVQNTMQSEMKSYSSALTENAQPAVISSDVLKKVVQAVVEEEDRSRNIMLFGLDEEKNETLSNKVDEIFVPVGEKPSFVASRVGKISGSNRRPVKVTLTCNGSVNQILAKAKRLRTVVKFKSVFLSPDRSPDERTQHRNLVLELKQRISELPDKKHYIRDGHIVTTEKPKT
ncbi:hypothetical protein ACHWQZ_G009758 [Mnemiopsis leidyi]